MELKFYDIRPYDDCFGEDANGDLLHREDLLDWLTSRLGNQSPAETLRELKTILRGEEI